MDFQRKLKWDRRFLQLAEVVASWSKDQTKVGAVIVNPATKAIVGMGYNGFPRGVEDRPDRINIREEKYKFTAHAELNAILNAGQSVRGYHIYVVPTMMVPNSCPECAKAIIQAGITEVYGWSEENLTDRWQDLAKYSKAMFDEAGVKCFQIPRELK